MKTNRIKLVLALALVTALGTNLMAAPADYALSILKDAGAVEYAEKAPYGAGINAMYIGFDAAGQPVIGVADRETKTYAKVQTVVAVKKQDGTFKISAAEVTDPEKLKGESRNYVMQALDDISGREFSSADDSKGLIDTVSGATKYYKAIYISYGLMASRIIGELNQAPDWQRSALP
jgi:hypothetical protein